MAEFRGKSLCILGRQPVLGIAELESLYGAEHIKPAADYALLDIEAGEINFRRLGGTIKVARILAVIDSIEWQKIEQYLLKNIPPHLEHLPAGKFTLGLSAYGLNTDVKNLNSAGMLIKKIIRKSDRAVRVVPNKNLALSSAQVLYNKLTSLGAWELLLVADGARTILAQTMFVQDINAYAARDHVRPARDPRVGMLPPKLAQIIINLAVGAPGSKVGHVNDKAALSRVTVLDPFCGTGVILQEGLLMGYSVMGGDVDPRMIDYSKQNIQWLVQNYPEIEGRVVIEAGDATQQMWPPFSVVAAETALGPPLTSIPSADTFKQIMSDSNRLHKKFLQNLLPQLRQDRKVCLAIPSWRHAGKLLDLPLIDQISDLGYNWWEFKHVSKDDLVYFREDQIVARRLLVLTKK